MGNRLYIVLPCYNEQEVLPETSARLKEKMDVLKETGQVAPDSRILFVDDGSKDDTWQMISQLHFQHPESFSGLKLSRNRGHQNALLCGLMTAKEVADIVISMDADLQDDIEVIDGFLQKYNEGCDVVYGVRNDRTNDTAFKRMTAQGYYKGLKFMGADVIYNHADCRLMSKRALDGLAEFSEVNLFLRGMVPLVGYRSAIVSYERGKRFAGESKYPLKKMLAFAWDGITSFSVKPLRMITAVGFLVFLVSLLLILYSLVRNLIGQTVAGWSSLMISIWMVGGLQIFSMGIVGEYVGKIYSESKRRPRYIVETFLNQ